MRFESENDKYGALSTGRLIRQSNNFLQVYLNHNLTEVERNLDKELRHKRNEKNINEIESNQPFRGL